MNHWLPLTPTVLASLVSALFLLSGCAGTPAPLPPTPVVVAAVTDPPAPTIAPAVTPTAAPTITPTATATASPTATATLRPTPTPTEVLPTPTATAETLRPPQIEGLTLVQNKDTNRWEYWRGKERVAYFTIMQIGTEPVKAGQTPEFRPSGVVVVTDAKLMQQLLAENNPRAEVDKGNFKVLLPFEPTEEMKLGVYLWPDGVNKVLAIKNIPKDFCIIQPFPRTTVNLNKYKDAQGVAIDFVPDVTPKGWTNVFLAVNYVNGQKADDLPFNIRTPFNFGDILVSNIAGPLPARYHVKGAEVFLAMGNNNGDGTGLSFDLHNIIHIGDALVAAGAK